MGALRLASLSALLLCVAIAAGATDNRDEFAVEAEALWHRQLALLHRQVAMENPSDGGADSLHSTVLNDVSTDYLGWPPGAPDPRGAEDSRSWIPLQADNGYHCADFTWTGVTRSSDTAVLFWNTRCSAPEANEPGFQYASAAVWVFRDGRWQLLANLGRRKPAREADRYDELTADVPEQSPALPARRLSSFSPASPVEEQINAKDQLWQAEQEILAARGRNDFEPYLRYASENYLAWPPDVALPMNKDTLRRMIATVDGLENERKSLRFAGYTQVGGTAVIYWHSHRTRTRSGEAVDHHNATTGIWSFEDDRWRLLGVLSRRKSPEVLQTLRLVTPQSE